MENLIELFKKLEELSKSFEVFKGFKSILPDKTSEYRNFDFSNINFFNSYKTGTPYNLLSVLPLFKYAEFYMNKIQKMYFEFGYEKIYKEIKEIPFFKSNLFNGSNFASYFKIFNNFSSYNFKIDDIEKSFSKGLLEINNSDSKSSSSSFITKNEKYERYEFNLEEDFDRFGEKLAEVLKASIKNKDRAKGY